jgi:hypothetical protein
MSDAVESAQSATRSSRGAGAVPEVVWAPLAAAVLTLVPGLLALATGAPLLFASLGPTAFVVAAQPQSPMARFSNVVAGHAVGFAAGAAAVLLLGAADAPSVFVARELAPPRLWASVLAVAATLLAAAATRIGLHPPAAATTLLVTLGGFRPTWSDAATVAIGVLVVAAVGEVLRRLRLAQPGQK